MQEWKTERGGGEKTRERHKEMCFTFIKAMHDLILKVQKVNLRGRVYHCSTNTYTVQIN